ncbi:capsular polysaccharide biosynthesis protein [Robbsia sp. Bb-Pol-6]|uniref:Capsular polysaccharide biosynthesis protein n=1 Tax=Robbsia betulipollinis TaxID=2981849 RepID=A0ABT3ZK99_9BURK|nr:capsular polysaccharide biosynthesis protein [Robbsia betulipollinis]MCY0386877.1 capsular polysaccharide biosynthesis protein [Robbsia betulipollinis]
MSAAVPGVVAIPSRTLARRPFIDTLLGARVRAIGPALPRAHGIAAREMPCAERWTAVAGWGNRPSGQRAAQLAMHFGLPLWRLEDGFLRSDGDATDPQGLSLCVDDVGIYYDARGPSRLERLIAAAPPAGSGRRCDALLAAWRDHRLSKYNHARDATTTLFREHVLVCDQTRGDRSIEGALATPATFRHMLEAALDNHPGHPVVLKLHPDVFSGRKRGHIDSLSAGMASRIRILGSHQHAPDLLEHAAAVYTVSSQMGFEALLWRRPVHIFGMPFYAGWGLTTDALPAPARRGAADLHALVHAALVAYPRYVDPETGQRCEAERVIAHIALQRRMRARFPQTVHAIGFSRWKRPAARAFFSGSELRFIRSARQLPKNAEAIATWGLGARPLPAHAGARTWIRVEDGFLRSVGLGARLVSPRSWVLDPQGLHYDAQGPSGLETLIETGPFDPALLARARALASTLTARRISKYNLTGAAWHRPASAGNVLLVVGQVEGDASLARGSPTIATNRALLEAVRALEPDAYIAYKPHPDVVAGLRRGAVPADVLHRLCDAVLRDTPVLDALAQADAIHVMTSLTGFEALLRGKVVVTHGWPFYAGWGLTLDRCPAIAKPHRRAASLEELIAATLILYPTYISAATGRFTSPERTLHELGEMRDGARRIEKHGRWPAWLLRWATRK